MIPCMKNKIVHDSMVVRLFDTLFGQEVPMDQSKCQATTQAWQRHNQIGLDFNNMHICAVLLTVHQMSSCMTHDPVNYNFVRQSMYI